ncbi:unnamed protein product [Rotaria magnacalcarata]|uniref:Uncharacterized protein n=1 Tax=Rotaria magnacalcarata TaxID=392030 RepID=A0A818YS97_9BILA|nr:unnamed protein product [Rotaria magnacalcarata]CAF2173759.1 unnamed protein product [Rotaria magnacalcarata]CAF3759271.1 unnamed protein product [Rotaria magnacalcarata]CAF3805542.1 unnamed protein product [Rotaria magnacalcarata]
MFATAADCTNSYIEQTVYDSEWTEHTPTGTSWLNLLTSQPIPEETDSFDGACTSMRSRNQTDCSSSSIESCYVVLEIQRQRSLDDIPNKTEDTAEVAVEEEEEEEEEEEVHEDANDEEEEEDEEEIEELNFAQTITDDNQKVDYDQIAVPMTIEIPTAEHVECKHAHFNPTEEYAQTTEITIQETPNDMLFHKARVLSKFTKRIKAISYAKMREQNYSASSDDESLTITKLRTITKINDYYPTAVVTVAAEPNSSIQHSDSFCNSTTSIDSIEKKPLPSSPVQTRTTTTTFSNLSSQRSTNLTQSQRLGPAMGTTTLTRTFAFDRACMEKYGRVQGQENEPIDIAQTTIAEHIVKREKGLSQKQIQQTEQLSNIENTLHCRSFINHVPTSIYADSETNTIDDSDFEHHSLKPSLPPISNSLTKSSSILGLMKKYARAVKTEYRFAHKNSNNPSAEPTLLEVKYLDGRNTLKDVDARESFKKPQKLSSSIASRINRLGLHNRASTQDLASTTSSFYASYRTRMLNRFRSFIENNLAEPPLPTSSLPQSRSWQHKSITELFHENKYTVNRQR